MVAERTLIICSKSRWSPAIRREHAVARSAAQHGYRVVFIEHPRDVRAIAGPECGRWLRALIGRPQQRSVAAGIDVMPRATVVPPHRGRLGIELESVLLRRAIASGGDHDVTVVATTPWQWPALAGLPGVRRVFDCADDWSTLIPRARKAVHEQYRRIAAQADAVIVVNEAQLSRLFGPRAVAVVPNGTDEHVLSVPLSPPPQESVIAYSGTVSERFDVALVARVMEQLTEWRLHIYGECRYAGRGDRPAPEFRELLGGFPGRIAWHGAVERTELASRLDAAQVLVLPHRHGWTGDVMKLYDYAARGRPIVSTRWSTPLSEDPPPGVYLADTATAFADAVCSAARESPEVARARRDWAEARSWERRRWPSWADAAFGQR